MVVQMFVVVRANGKNVANSNLLDQQDLISTFHFQLQDIVRGTFRKYFSRGKVGKRDLSIFKQYCLAARTESLVVIGFKKEQNNHKLIAAFLKTLTFFFIKHLPLIHLIFFISKGMIMATKISRPQKYLARNAAMQPKDFEN